MTNEILQKAIAKAVENGFTGNVPKYMRTPENILANYFNLPAAFIFSPDFAKAFWGEDSGRIVIGNLNSDRLIAQEVIPDWKMHLQQMVLEEDPIKYLEKFL